MIFLESVWGCLRDCPTKCVGWGNKPEIMPTTILESLIKQCKEINVPNIQLYGRGDINGYPFSEIEDISGCEVSVTNISYHMVDMLRNKGVKVYSRIDTSDDARDVPRSDGYFTVELPSKSFKEVLESCKTIRPFAIKSLDSHLKENSYGYDIRACNFPPPFDKPTKIFSYTIPSSYCRIPLVTYFNGNIYYQQCISGEDKYIKFTSIKSVMEDKKCSNCRRFPKQKRIYYYE